VDLFVTIKFFPSVHKFSSRFVAGLKTCKTVGDAKEECVLKTSLLDAHGANLLAIINSQATSLVKVGLKATFLRPAAASLTDLCSSYSHRSILLHLFVLIFSNLSFVALYSQSVGHFA